MPAAAVPIPSVDATLDCGGSGEVRRGEETMRRSIIAILISALLGTFVAVAVAAPAAEAGSRVKLTKKEKAILTLINKERRKRGLRALKLRKSLTTAARRHSREMARKRYFSHRSRNGRTPGQRMRKAGYSWYKCRAWKVGENIAWATSGCATAEATVKAWMASKSHRKIILTRSFRDIGVGNARGSIRCGGRTLRNVTFFTIDLGVRRR
jgi:uncharacterized protein YkwD